MTPRAQTAPVTAFGAGGAEPYTRALHAGGGALHLHHAGDPVEVVALPLSRYLGAASDAEVALVGGIPGPILDVGCGPGRMVAAAMHTGRTALGIDVSDAAVALAVERGIPALRHSVFDPLPREGRWGSVLLIDGNIGIGGDPGHLLRRCGALVRPGGLVVVEAHADPARDIVRDSVVIGIDGPSAAFPWAEVGTAALTAHARLCGLAPARHWRTTTGRVFTAYASAG